MHLGQRQVSGGAPGTETGIGRCTWDRDRYREVHLGQRQISGGAPGTETDIGRCTWDRDRYREVYVACTCVAGESIEQHQGRPSPSFEWLEKDSA